MRNLLRPLLWMEAASLLMWWYYAASAWHMPWAKALLVGHANLWVPCLVVTTLQGVNPVLVARLMWAPMNDWEKL